MFNSRINGLLIGASMVAVLAGCSSSKDPFQMRMERPTEQCLSDVADAGNAQAAFGNRQVLRYVVKKGDTLWGIARRFLVKPWYWKSLWYDNPQIRNPHKIYPGDVISVISLNGEKRITITEANTVYHGADTGRRTADGRKIYKFKPQPMREYSLNAGPITIANQTIAPFLLKAEVFNPERVKQLPFIFGNAGDYLTLTNQDAIYARNVPQGIENFSIYRPVNLIVDPHTKQAQSDKPVIIGQEMAYIGEATVTGFDVQSDLTELEPVELTQTLQEKDVLVPAPKPIPEGEEPDYFPRLPSLNCRRGYMFTNTNKTTMSVKEFDTVVTSFGRDNQAQVGDIWKIVRPGPLRMIDGKPVQIPSKELGYLMIIKVYDNYSLGFVLDSSQNIDITDWLVRP